MIFGTVLDLPLERQKEIAAEHGQSLEEWRDAVSKRLERAAEVSARLDANAIDFDDLTPEEQASELLWQARVDAQNIISVDS